MLEVLWIVEALVLILQDYNRVADDPYFSVNFQTTVLVYCEIFILT